MQNETMEVEVIILVADDDCNHTRLMCEYFLRAGLRNAVVCFENGQEILDYIYGPKFDPNYEYLILLDIMMPCVDGVEVLTRLKSDPKYSHIPVIIITNVDDQKQAEKCLKIGCSYYLTKPLNFKIFAETISKLGFCLIMVKAMSAGGSE